MAYEKQTWTDGVSPLNAARMNHMEEGIAAAGEGITVQSVIQSPRYRPSGDSNPTQPFSTPNICFKTGDRILMSCRRHVVPVITSDILIRLPKRYRPDLQHSVLLFYFSCSSY